MLTFKNISAKENKALLKFPVYITMLAASCDDKLDHAGKKSAVKLVKANTFICDPLLSEFYREVSMVFHANIDELDKELPKEKSSRESALKARLFSLEKIVLKLGKDYDRVMHLSMKSFKAYVSKAHHNVLIDFVFPIPIPGLTENL
jgi:hypothetical protein